MSLLVAGEPLSCAPLHYLPLQSVLLLTSLSTDFIGRSVQQEPCVGRLRTPVTVFAVSLMFFATLALLNSPIHCILDVQVCDTLRSFPASCLGRMGALLGSRYGPSAAREPCGVWDAGKLEAWPCLEMDI